MAFDLADLEANLNDDPLLLALPELGGCTILFSVDDARFVLQTGSNITVREAAGIDDSWDFSFTRAFGAPEMRAKRRCSLGRVRRSVDR